MKQIELIKNPDEFFYSMLRTAFQERAVRVSTDTEYYVVSMLSRFVRSDHYFSKDEMGRYSNDPLCFLLKEAEEEGEPEAKRLLFRQVGDSALYKVGILKTKSPSPSYYGMLGKCAYSTTAKLYGRTKVQGLYQELAEKFDHIALALMKLPIIKSE